MWARLRAWASRPVLTPDVIAIPHSALADRFDAVKLRCLTVLDEQARHRPEDRDDQLIDLAVDVLNTLGVGLAKPSPGEVPVVPGWSL